MPRIAMISDHASPLAALGGADAGGQNVYVAKLGAALAARGYAIDVFTRRVDARAPAVVRCGERLRVVHVPAGPACFVRKEDLLPYMGEFTRFVRRVCARGGGYDVVHANFWLSGLVAADVKRALGIPFVITFHALGRVRRLHQGEADGFPDARFEIEDRIVREADRIIAECPQDREDLLTLYGAAAERIEVIPCGFDPAELSPVERAVARRAIGQPPQEPLLLQLGRVVPRKGIDIVIRALPLLQRIRPRLLVVGGDADHPDPARTPELGRLRLLADALGVADRVTFTGRRPRASLKYYYSAADVFVTTPWYEPFGITPIEAMACARPVVGARVGGIQYTVRDRETGYLVPPQDPAAVADRVGALYEERADRMRRFGAAGLVRARRLFTWSRVARQVATVYEAARCGVLRADHRSGSVSAGSSEATCLS